MKRVVTFAALAVFGALFVTAAPVSAQTAGQSVETGGVVRKQARTKLRVRPLYPYRRYHSLYPVPYDVEYPGPNAKRDCVARYVEEHRLSGTVVVPRVNCRWVRG